MVRAEHKGGCWRDNIKLRSSHDTGLIVLGFGESIDGLAIDPDSAIELAFELIKHAYNLKGKEREYTHYLLGTGADIPRT